MSIHRERIIEGVLEYVRPGADVYTVDGERIGAVKLIDGEWVRIDAALSPDYWLNADFIVSASDDRVGVSFAKRDLGGYKVQDPDREATLTPEPSVESDAALSPGEQVAQRVRMERELAEQRRNLPHMHPSGEDRPPDTFGTLGEPVESELSRLQPMGGEDRPEPREPESPGRGPGRRMPVVPIAIVAGLGLAAAAWWLRARRR